MIIQELVSLKDKNWFRTGGVARFFSEPTTPQETSELCVWARNNGLELYILGHGANVLISDDGFDGLVIRPQLQHTAVLYQDNTIAHITAGAGVLMDGLIEWCLTNSFLGLEEFSGIPGTIGGSVYINLHYYQFLLEHFLLNAHVLDIETGAILYVDKDWFLFGYNQSRLQQKKHILLDAVFIVKKVGELEVAYARGRRAEIIRHRAARYPSSNTCGSFFRNFHADEVRLESNGKKMIYVAYYLDKIGVKGTLRVGDALVSHQHANMIINTANATTSQIVQLARTMQEYVQDQFGIVPQPECQLIGFENSPFLPPPFDHTESLF